MTGGTALPPVQRRAALRRFGLPQFAGRQSVVSVPPAVKVSGPSGSVAELAMKPLLEGAGRRDQTSALHCVTTWSALNLHWGGVTFRDVHDAATQLVPSAASAQWVSFIGADGYSACMFLEDALSADLMIADELGGSPLAAEHGAPIRVVAPQHYGYKHVKHLVAIKYRTSFSPGSAGPLAHPRGRVMLEERSQLLPGYVWRRVWRVGKPAVRAWFALHRTRISTRE